MFRAQIGLKSVEVFLDAIYIISPPYNKHLHSIPIYLLAYCCWWRYRFEIPLLKEAQILLLLTKQAEVEMVKVVSNSYLSIITKSLMI
jgi:hypothetical protein